MSKKPKKKYPRPSIEDDLYDALVEYANSINKNPSRVANTAIKVYLRKKGYWED